MKKKARRVAPDDQQRQTQVRMSDNLKERIREYQQQVKDRRGYEIGFSAAVRSLIEKGLEVGA